MRRPIRSFHQGPIQIAASYHRWSVKHRQRGVQLSIEKGIKKLTRYHLGYIDVDGGAMIVDTKHMAFLFRDEDSRRLAPYHLANFPRLQCQKSRRQDRYRV